MWNAKHSWTKLYSLWLKRYPKNFVNIVLWIPILFTIQVHSRRHTVYKSPRGPTQDTMYTPYKKIDLNISNKQSLS